MDLPRPSQDPHQVEPEIELMEGLNTDTEISEADILDQSEIVNKKREEMLALLKQLEDQMKQEAVAEVISYTFKIVLFLRWIQILLGF